MNPADRLVTRLWPLVAAVVVAGAILATSGASKAAVSAVRGSALGYEAQISLFGGAQPHDGPNPSVTLTADASNSPQAATAASGIVKHGPATFFTSDKLDVASQGTTGPSGSVSSSSDVLNVNRSTTQPNATGSEIFSADRVHSACAAAGTKNASTTFTNAVLQTDNGDDTDDPSATPPRTVHAAVNVDIPANPAPNYTVAGHIHVNGSRDDFHVIFNEQVANGDGSTTVNAVHEYLDGPTATGYLIIGQSVCGITGAPDATTTSSAPGSTTSTTAGSSGSSTTTSSTSTSTTSSTSTTAPSTTSTTRAATTTTAAPAAVTLTLSSNEAAPGDQRTLTGGGLPPDTTLTINFLSAPISLGTVTTDRSGGFQKVVTIPSGAATGSHEINVTDGGGRVLATVALTVVSRAPLARTGADIQRLSVLGASALLFGSILFVLPRPRRVRRRA